jgi:hypothetical protein
MPLARLVCQLEIGLVNEGLRLKSMAEGLAGEPIVSDSTKLRVDVGEEAIQRPSLALSPPKEQVRFIFMCGHISPSDTILRRAPHTSLHLGATSLTTSS